jgi:hypothetical protein
MQESVCRTNREKFQDNMQGMYNFTTADKRQNMQNILTRQHEHGKNWRHYGHLGYCA